MREAAAAGARLIVLPEAFLGGYPKGLDFGVTVGSRSPEGRDVFRRYREAAVELSGPEIARLADLAAEQRRRRRRWGGGGVGDGGGGGTKRAAATLGEVGGGGWGDVVVGGVHDGDVHE